MVEVRLDEPSVPEMVLAFAGQQAVAEDPPRPLETTAFRVATTVRDQTCSMSSGWLTR
jgi:hypothetical protein